MVDSETTPATQTIAELLRAATARLQAAGSYSPRLDAEVLLRHALSIDRTKLFGRFQEPANPEFLVEFARLVDERSKGVPVAYLIGAREFMGLSFAVRQGVLVPRPETELLVEWALDWLRSRPNATVVDVGTGSGAIVLSLAKSAADLWRGPAIGIDASVEALSVAKENRVRFGLEDRVELIAGDLLAPLSAPVDLILANLPYLTPRQIADNADLEHEPREALDGGEDGLEVIRRFIDDAPHVLCAGGAVGLELDPSQAQVVTSLAEQRFPNSRVRINKDLTGQDRFVIVECNNIVESE